jgi:hypothetical protein
MAAYRDRSKGPVPGQHGYRRRQLREYRIKWYTQRNRPHFVLLCSRNTVRALNCAASHRSCERTMLSFPASSSLVINTPRPDSAIGLCSGLLFFTCLPSGDGCCSCMPCMPCILPCSKPTSSFTRAREVEGGMRLIKQDLSENPGPFDYTGLADQ